MTRQDILSAWRTAQAKEQQTFEAWMAVKDIDLKHASKLSKQLAREQQATQHWFSQLETAAQAA